jgi:hypothetical protein
MTIQEAQREMRRVFVGGAVGQLVSGVLWLISAGLGTWVSVPAGYVSLFLMGMFIFPLTQLALKIMGRPAAASKQNALNALAMQVAFVVPLCLPVIYAAARYNLSWYYPAFLIVVGAHYLAFMTLYGMRIYAALAGILIVGGVAIAMAAPSVFTAGGWFGGVALVGFAAVLWRIAMNEDRREGLAQPAETPGSHS